LSISGIHIHYTSRSSEKESNMFMENRLRTM
jgi:hypothetical protein